MTKIAIVIGHNSKARGAVRALDGVTEYEWNGDLAEAIKDHAPEHVRIFRRDPALGYGAQIRKVYGEVDEWGAACSIELHFNALGPTSEGGLTLSSGSAGSMRLAEMVQAASHKALGNRDRGVIVRGKSDRGGLSLHTGKAPAIMTEPYFGSNADECRIADERKAALAEAVFSAAADFVGLKTGAGVSDFGPVSAPDAPSVSGGGWQAPAWRQLARWRVAELRDMAAAAVARADEILDTDLKGDE